MRFYFGSVFLFFSFFAISQDIFDQKSSIQYSKYLVKTNNFEAAVKEYNRINFLKWDNDTILYQMGLLYWLNNDNHQYFKNRLQKEFPISKYSKLTQFLDLKSKNPNISTDTIDQVFYLKSLVFDSKWSLAQDFVIGNSLIPKNEKANAFKIINQGLKTKTRKPIIGSLLSSIVPGLGKVYAKEYKDAAFALLFVSTSVFSLTRVVRKNGWDSPWSYFLASVSTGFYLGNIFGSYHSVKKYNTNQLKKIRNEKFQYLLD